MKLRIRGNSIRFRLNRSEVEALGTVGLVKEFVDFEYRGHSNFTYAIEKNSSKSLCASFENGTLTVRVPKNVVDQWVDGDEVSIGGVDGNLEILIEKDFACLKPRTGEDESDNFPNPNILKSC